MDNPLECWVCCEAEVQTTVVEAVSDLHIKLPHHFFILALNDDFGLNVVIGFEWKKKFPMKNV